MAYTRRIRNYVREVARVARGLTDDACFGLLCACVGFRGRFVEVSVREIPELVHFNDVKEREIDT